jgi:putative transposase
MSAPDRRVLVDRGHPALSIRRQCALLSVARSGVYRAPPAANDDDDLAMMRRIDELFTAWPFLGSRRITAMLRTEGHVINRKRVRRLMRKMRIAALGPKPRTTKPAPGTRYSRISCAVWRSSGRTRSGARISLISRSDVASSTWSQ